MPSFSTLLATCFGIGRIPVAPGTFASAAALPLAWVLARMGWQSLVAGAVIATIVGIWACDRYARKAGVHDPSECVIDEVAGQWFALAPIAIMARANDWWLYLLSFLLFRFFDITKFWPMSATERLPGGLGIMMDDVLAGFIAALLLYADIAMRWI
jgi:phosphatidylglycerophosphatase A